jgi:hypothetical protein
VRGGKQPISIKLEVVVIIRITMKYVLLAIAGLIALMAVNAFLGGNPI